MVADTRLLALVQEAAQGNEQAVERLCAEKAQSILFSAANILKNYADAEDVAQEVVLKVQRGISRLKQPEYFDVWLYRIILNECTNLKRKEPKWDFDEGEYTDRLQEERTEFLPQEYAEDREKRRGLMKVIQRLRPKHKELVLMHYYEDMSYSEIASVMDIPVSKVGNDLRVARKKIRMELESFEKKGAPIAENFVALPVLSLAMRMSAEEMFPQAGMQAWVASLGSAGTAGETATAGSKTAGAAQSVLSGNAVLNIGVAAAVCVLIAIPFVQGEESLKAISDSVIPLYAAEIEEEPPQEPEETLEIESVSFADSESSGEQELTIGSFGMSGLLEGGVRLKTKNGDVVAGGEKYLSGLPLSVTNEAGREIARILTDGSGQFFYDGGDERYEVSLDLAGTPFSIALKQAPEGIFPDIGQDSVTGDITIYVQKRYSPDFLIEFAAGDCACGHVNPIAAIILYNDFPDAVFEWTVTDRDGSVISTGSGQECEEPGRLLETGAHGAYTIEWVVRDVLDYETRIWRDFKIVSESVDLRQYG